MLRKVWRYVLARFRLDLAVVCEEREGLPADLDFHDPLDATDGDGLPASLDDFVCRRCGKRFSY